MASAPATFILFGKLPAEIRCEIWKLAATGPRIVAIKFDRNKAQYQSRISTPAILRVNHESRQEALKIYHELLLGPGRNVGCYVDLTRDTVYLSGSLTRTTNRIRIVHIPPAPLSLKTAGFHGSNECFSLPAIESNNTGSYACIVPFGREGTSRARYTELILDDLMSSPDGKAMLQDLHIDFDTWQLMRTMFWRCRHEHPRHVERLSLICERGNGPLRDIQLHEIIPVPEPPEGVERPKNWAHDCLLRRIKMSFIASNSFKNRRDRAMGLPEVLTRKITMKALERCEIGFEFGI